MVLEAELQDSTRHQAGLPQLPGSEYVAILAFAEKPRELAIRLTLHIAGAIGLDRPAHQIEIAGPAHDFVHESLRLVIAKLECGIKTNGSLARGGCTELAKCGLILAKFLTAR